MQHGKGQVLTAAVAASLLLMLCTGSYFGSRRSIYVNASITEGQRGTQTENF
jgi:hypothetical protein